MKQKGLNEIVRNIINNIHDTLPNIDTKQGTFIRDVFINPISDEIASIYTDMKILELSQSVLTASGNYLDKLAGNYFITRKSATHSYGKVRFYIKDTDRIIKDEDLPKEIVIPEGTIISTLGSYTQSPIQVKTNESVYITRDRIKSLPIDADNGSFRFIEVSAQSIEVGSHNNIGAGELIQQVNNISSDIVMVTNPYSFSGGTDYEDDNSLLMRINLAISGSNIGTKDGYLSYVLKQNGVLDAKVVGGGDPIMFRDGGYINNEGKYIIGKGGMVDIYVRGQLNEEEEYEFTITNDYVNGANSFSDIVLPSQPINNIVSITTNTGKSFINAQEYEIEKGVIIDADGSMISDIKYYKDLEWDFSIKDNFPDTVYYPLPSDLNEFQIQELKSSIDEELKDALIYMSNVNYSLNWSLMHTDNSDAGRTRLFNKWFYNSQVYKIVARDSRLNGRVFIKKNDKIFVRVYQQPDFILVKDETPTGSSVQSKDKIKWLNGNKPSVDEVLLIKYNFDQLIRDLQDGIETKRVLTGDVLVKQAKKLPIEIIIEATAFPTYDLLTVKKNIADRIVTYIDNIKKMGGEFDRSDIVSTAHQTEGVDSINIDNIKISELGMGPKKKIVAADNEYFKVESIIVNVYSSDQIIL